MKRRALFAAVVLLAVAAMGARAQDAEVQGASPVDASPVDASPVEQVFEQLAGGAAPQVSARLLSENGEAWRERWKVVAGVQRTLDWTCFEVGDDAFAASLMGLMARRARAGVTMRVLVDAKGSTRMLRSRVGQRWLKVLAASGKVTVKLFNPVGSALVGNVLTPTNVVSANHQKLLIADGSVVVMGGRNTARDYLAPIDDCAKAWRDMDVVAGGAAAEAARAVFERGFDSAVARAFPAGEADPDDVKELDQITAAMEGWMNGTPVAKVPEGAEELAEYAHLKGALGRPDASSAVTCPAFLLSKTAKVQAVADGLTEHLRSLIAAARQEVVITSPYVVLSPTARKLLKDASARGVKIVLHTNSPETTNSLVSQVPLYREWMDVLHESPNLRIFARRGESMLHAKLYVIDRKVVVIGSYNLDSLSEQVNAEDAIVLKSPELAAQVAAEIGRDLRQASEYRIKVAADGSVTPVFGPADACSPEIRRKLESFTVFAFLRPVL